MNDIKAGDRVRIKERPDWFLPSGYKPASYEGTVFEVVEISDEFVTVLLDEDITGIDKSIPLAFRKDALEKI